MILKRLLRQLFGHIHPGVPKLQRAGVRIAAGDEDRAFLYYQASLAKDPSNSQATLELSALLQRRGQWEAAADLLREFLDVRPNQAEAAKNLGICLRELGKAGEAEAWLRRAVALDPSLGDAHYTLGNFAYIRGDLDGALQSYDNAQQFLPNELVILAARANTLMAMGRVQDGVDCARSLVERNPKWEDAYSILLLWLNMLPGVSREDLLQEHLRWAERCVQSPHPNRWMHVNVRDSERRLRVGYVSPYLNRQPTGYFMEPILRCHNPEQFEVFVYSDVKNADHVTDRLRGMVANWRDIIGLDNDKFEQAIRRDAIDVLVDLAGHNAGNRLSVFARKPAPVQIAYLGYLSTTGLPTMDYRLTDAYADPPGTERYYTETLLRLPGSQWCFQPDLAAPDVCALPALTRHHVTFGSFHNPAKINTETIATWAKLLHGVPEARLIMVGVSFGSAIERLRRAFDAQGIPESRIAVLPPLPYEDYLRQYHGVDIALDVFPYNGATTTCESLWMGVPVVTLAGDAGASRSGASILCNVGLPQLVTQNTREYVQVARTLAANLESLAQLRSGLRQRLRQSSIMDAPGFTRHLEAAFRSAWRNWCAKPC